MLGIFQLVPSASSISGSRLLVTNLRLCDRNGQADGSVIGRPDLGGVPEGREVGDKFLGGLPLPVEGTATSLKG